MRNEVAGERVGLAARERLITTVDVEHASLQVQYEDVRGAGWRRLTRADSGCGQMPEHSVDELLHEELDDRAASAIGSGAGAAAMAQVPERVASGTNLPEASSRNMAWSIRSGTEKSSRE